MRTRKPAAISAPPIPAGTLSETRRRMSPISRPPAMVPTPKRAMRRPTPNWLRPYRVVAKDPKLDRIPDEHEGERDHRAGERAGQEARADELPGRDGEGGEDRADAEPQPCCAHHRNPARAVRERTIDKLPRAVGQRVARHGEADRARGGATRRGDGRQHRRQDAQVHGHQEGQGDKQDEGGQGSRGWGGSARIQNSSEGK